MWHYSETIILSEANFPEIFQVILHFWHCPTFAINMTAVKITCHCLYKHKVDSSPITCIFPSCCCLCLGRHINWEVARGNCLNRLIKMSLLHLRTWVGAPHFACCLDNGVMLELVRHLPLKEGKRYELLLGSFLWIDLLPYCQKLVQKNVYSPSNPPEE